MATIPPEAFGLPAAERGSLQQRIRQMVTEGVLSGRFRPGGKMPSSRGLAAHLQISRLTVTLAYAELVAQDYLAARGRSGYYISDNAPLASELPAQATRVEAAEFGRIAGRFTGGRGVERPEDWERYPFPFIYGQADPSLFDHHNWRQCALRALGRRDFAAMTADYYERDDPLLIEHLLRHLSAPDNPGEPLPLEYGGETMQLDVSRRQLLNLLLSTYENILQQNTKLEEMHSQLQTASQQLGESLQKTQDLLYRVFPRQIADELANAGQSQPRHFDAVTVLFTDFVGFTRVAETMAPQQLIDGLEEYFRRFDALTAKCHMEKLKTIGDAYVAAGGVPVANTTHHLDAALLAMAIRECVAEAAREWEGTAMPSFAIRIGLHTGPLVAGVVGEQRFTYDLWGDTVNTASRMESGGEAGRINISDATFRLVEPFFECSPRGSIAVKNRTAVEMYFLERLRPEFSADPAGLTPNERFHEARAQLQAAAAPPA